jgi:gliding motility-associated-like protein
MLVAMAQSLCAQSDYAKYRLFDSGYVDFTAKSPQYVNKAPFELPWLYQGKHDSVYIWPLGFSQANRYMFIQDTTGALRYYADHAGVYSNRSGVLFQSYLMNKKSTICWPSDLYYPIPNTPKIECGVSLDTMERFAYSNCVRFGKTNQYGVGIWDYRNNGFRLLRLNYDPVVGDKIVSSSILPNAGKLTSITCGPIDSTFWVVTMLKNMHTIQVYLWSYNTLQLTQSIEIGDTSHLYAYADRMKFSPDNSEMVLLKRYKNSSQIFRDQSKPQNTSYLFDFNAQNGILSNQQKMPIYGYEFVFSPNSKILYITHMDSNMDLTDYRGTPRNLSSYRISSKSTKSILRNSYNFCNIQLMPDGNIYLKDYADINSKYILVRLEDCNDPQTVKFKQYYSNIDFYKRYRLNQTGGGFLFCPEILACKCYEPEPLPAKIESCIKDTLVILNHLRRYDSLHIDWGDGSSDFYEQLDNTFKHAYTHSGKYIVKTNYKSVFQEFTTVDTIVTTTNKPLNISKDTFFCPTDTFSLDLTHHDSNLVWSSTDKSVRQFNKSGSFKYQYKEHWCNFEDSIYVTQRSKPWDLPYQDTVICQGKEATMEVPNNLRVRWDDNPTDSIHTKRFNTSGSYVVRFTDGFCKFEDSVSVNLAPPMNLGVFQADTSICHLFTDLEFQITGEIKKMKSITWNSEISNAQHFLTRELKNIQITATDIHSCCEFVTISPISKCNPIIFIPNAFTPNDFGPDANEHFKPIIKDGIIKSFKIYNRWGQKIFDNPDNEGWDGTDRHMKSPEGVYIYEIEIVTNFKETKYVNRYFGNFQLIR